MKSFVSHIILMLFVVLSASAATTNDKVRLSSEGLLMPGGDAVGIAVMISGGEHTYTGYNIDILLPDGLSFEYDEAADSYAIPNTSMYNGHELLANLVTLDGRTALRVSSLSFSNKSFQAAEGKLFSFKVKVPLFTKPGALSIDIKNTDFATYKDKVVTPYHFADAISTDVTVSGNASTVLSVSATTQWGTMMIPFSATLPEGLTAYTCDSNDAENLILSPVTEIAAFTPYIIYSAQGFSGSLSGTVRSQDYPESDIISSGYLRAAIAPQTLTEGYVMQKQNDEVQFYKVNSAKPVTVAAGKCWAEIPSSLASKAAFGIVIDHGTGITTAPSATGNAPTTRYTTDGKMAATQQDRIVIRQGRKFKQ